MDLVTVRDSKVTSRGNFSQNGAIQVLDSVDSQLVANSFKSRRPEELKTVKTSSGRWG